jgi:hypothetical protein
MIRELFVGEFVGFDQVGVAEDLFHPLPGQANPLATEKISESAQGPFRCVSHNGHSVSNVSTTGIDIYRIERSARCADATHPSSICMAVRSTAAFAQPFAAWARRETVSHMTNDSELIMAQPRAVERLLHASDG